MNGLLIGWFLMFGPPLIGAVALRGNPSQWQRWILWMALCIFSFGVMHGADWGATPASWTIIAMSVIGAFAGELFSGVAGGINTKTLAGLGIIALLLLVGSVFMNANEEQRRNIFQWIIGIPLLIGVFTALVGSFGGKKK